MEAFEAEIVRICDRLNPSKGGDPCDECGAIRVGGERRYVLIVRVSFGNLLYSVCAMCAAVGSPGVQKEAERIRERLVSDAVAALVEAGPESVVLN